MKAKTASGRIPGMDIIRCIALFCVVSVHFFLHNGYYAQTVIGKRMYVMTLMRSFFIICVPLFLLLTGYLTCNKKVEKSYFKKIFHTLAIYTLASVVCTIYRIAVLHESYSFLFFIKRLISYRNAPYCWYIEMYIGLFLLCPFLNVLYKNLSSQKQKRMLIGCLLFMTTLPSITNIYIPNADWIRNPASSCDYWKVLPITWTPFYPVTYYFIGCYLKEFRPRIKPRYLFMLSCAVFIIDGSFNYYRSYNALFVSGPWQEYYGLMPMMQSVLVFCFFMNLDYSRVPERISSFFARISGLCLGGYMVSWIFDDHFYSVLNERIPYMPDRLEYYPLIVPVIYIASLSASYVIDFIYRSLGEMWQFFRKTATRTHT